jgi:class 3 adenylate cyclase
VPRLGAADRARLPDNAFAYVDTNGQRRLPIHDEAHVRNALARFNQVTFENDDARDRALTRLLKAAKRYRIVPVGFIGRQLQTERAQRGEGTPRPPLPDGFLTLLMSDIEGSTALVGRLGDRYGPLLNDIRAIQCDAVSAEGHVIDARADELFACFTDPDAAIRAAVAIQRSLRDTSWPDVPEVRIRIGIHSGYPTRTGNNYIGMAVHLTARICSAAHGAQVLVSGDTRTALTGFELDGTRFKPLGDHRLRGIPQDVALFQLTAKGLVATFPPPRTIRGAG